MRTIKVAVVDDDVEMGKLIRDILSGEGYQVNLFTSASEALARFKKDLPNVLITDLRMKDIDGMMFLKKVTADYPAVVSIMMTAFGSIETAIEALKLGAYHYIVKPFKMEELILQVKRAADRSRLTSENATLKQTIKKSFSLDNIVGKAETMQRLFDLIRKVGPASATVLITGESGSGKEVVARSIHAASPRSQANFVPINCAALPEHLLESELFGHVKGSFTGAIGDKRGLFEEANGGSLFLDEIGDLSSALQAKLLRVLQDKQIRPVGGNDLRTIDVRLIAATHRDLKAMVRDGKFREDLFYRLNVLPVRVPALRDRTEDIPLLVEHFINKFAAQNNSPVKGITKEALSKLMAHNWPGNVRELENVIERAVVLSQKELIDGEMIFDTALESAKESMQQIYADSPSLEKLEERYIRLILGQVGGKKDAAAKVLGINRRTLYRKERQYGLVAHGEEEPADETDPNPATLSSGQE